MRLRDQETQKRLQPTGWTGGPLKILKKRKPWYRARAELLLDLLLLLLLRLLLLVLVLVVLLPVLLLPLLLLLVLLLVLLRLLLLLLLLLMLDGCDKASRLLM